MDTEIRGRMVWLDEEFIAGMPGIRRVVDNAGGEMSNGFTVEMENGMAVSVIVPFGGVRRVYMETVMFEIAVIAPDGRWVTRMIPGATADVMPWLRPEEVVRVVEFVATMRVM